MTIASSEKSAEERELDFLLDPAREISSSEEAAIYPVDIQPDSARYSLFEIKRLIEQYEEIDLNPEFQRDFIWEPKQQYELIESILMGIPLPLFYFAIDKKGRYAVVDGLQRLRTILDFMNDLFRITKVNYLKRIERKKFSELDRSDRAKIEKYQIQAYIIPISTPERVKLDIFDRINRGGTKLNTQEMRHALYPGECTKLLKRLSESVSFKIATGMRLNNKRMRDKYVILRFLSIYLWRNKDYFDLGQYGFKTEISRDFDDFFAQYMQIINCFSENTIRHLETTFLNIMDVAYKLFGEEAFTRRHMKNMPFNMTLFDSLSYLLSRIIYRWEVGIESLRAIILKVEDDSLFNQKIKFSPSSIKSLKEHFDHIDNAIYFWRG